MIILPLAKEGTSLDRHRLLRKLSYVTYLRPGERPASSAMVRAAGGVIQGGVIQSEDLDLAVGVGADQGTEAARRDHTVVTAESPGVGTGLRITTPEGRFPTALEVEEAHIREALRRTGGNVTAAAELMGLSRQTVTRRLDALGIERPKRGT